MNKRLGAFGDACVGVAFGGESEDAGLRTPDAGLVLWEIATKSAEKHKEEEGGRVSGGG